MPGFESILLGGLLAASIILEWKLLSLNRRWRRWIINRQYLQLGISLMISLVVGHLFGASGLMCLTVGLVSTLIMNIFWWVWLTVAEMALPAKAHRLKAKVKSFKLSWPVLRPIAA